MGCEGSGRGIVGIVGTLLCRFAVMYVFQPVDQLLSEDPAAEGSVFAVDARIRD